MGSVCAGDGTDCGILSQSFALFQYSFESAICLPKKLQAGFFNMTIVFKGRDPVRSAFLRPLRRLLS